jgi:hypothetical protein
MEHPPYSPDLAPSGYCVFCKLNKEPRVRKFDKAEGIKTAVMEHFAGKEPESQSAKLVSDL